MRQLREVSKNFFFEKKKQKTFVLKRGRARCIATQHGLKE
jgi:hypothetical protein